MCGKVRREEIKRVFKRQMVKKSKDDIGESKEDKTKSNREVIRKIRGNSVRGGAQ